MEGAGPIIPGRRWGDDQHSIRRLRDILERRRGSRDMSQVRRGEGGGGSVIKLIAVGGSGIELDADGCLFFDLFAIVLVNVRVRRSPILVSDEWSDDRRASSSVRATVAGATSELNASDMIRQEWMMSTDERVMSGWIVLEMGHISTCSVADENLLSRQNIQILLTYYSVCK